MKRTAKRWGGTLAATALGAFAKLRFPVGPSAATHPGATLANAPQLLTVQIAKTFTLGGFLGSSIENTVDSMSTVEPTSQNAFEPIEPFEIDVEVTVEDLDFRFEPE